jgi:chromosome partitioning protein
MLNKGHLSCSRGKSDNHQRDGKIIVFANQKEGWARPRRRSTSARTSRKRGKRVLLVFDPEQHHQLGRRQQIRQNLRRDRRQGSREAGHPEVRCPTCRSSRPASTSREPVELVNEEKREFFLKRSLIPRRVRLHLCRLRPTLGLLTLNGLVAADFVIIPRSASTFALEGLSLLLKTVNKVRRASIRASRSAGSFSPCMTRVLRSPTMSSRR